MARSRKKSPPKAKAPELAGSTRIQLVASLLDAMQDGNEFGSIVSLFPRPDLDLLVEVSRSLSQIAEIRGHPCICYLGNVVRQHGEAAIDPSDDLPFIELVKSVPPGATKVDVLLSTWGGSGQQVSRFVNCLRARFEEVNFLIPSFCMSAGTLFALSGDHIWMTPAACLGPIDPQVPTRDGRFVPAQALLLLIRELQEQGDDALTKNKPVPWTAVRIVDSIDKKELGDAITASEYSTMMAAQFLQNYKFRHWTVRATSGLPVNQEYREQRAREIAAALASHDRWKSHGHAISREVLWDEIELKIEHPDATLERTLVRAWALATWIFDKTPALKLFVSDSYRYLKFAGSGAAK
jgi:hypothetical protein